QGAIRRIAETGVRDDAGSKGAGLRTERVGRVLLDPPIIMRILGIETSCDETSAAVVEETGDPARPWALKSNVIASQAPIHREWGGVVPELASRQHIRDICGVVDRALEQAG